MKVFKEVFHKPPYKGISVNCALSYVDSYSVKMVRICTLQGLSDRPSEQYMSYSGDNGRTWSESKLLGRYKEIGDDTIRYSASPWLDKHKGVLFLFWHEIYMIHDDVLSGLLRRKIFYQISIDGGKTFSEKTQIVESGEEYDEIHYMKDVWYGKNSASIGNIPIKLSQDEILLPLYYFPLDKDGKLYNPIGAYTFTNVMFLHGFWKNGYSRIEWVSSEPITIDPHRSTRGLSEPAVARLNNGDLIAIMRGSNDKMPMLPGYKWVSISDNDGWTWSSPKPLTYDTGEKIYSPASYSTLIRHSNGKLYWIGNITDKNPRGNSPRYPLIIGEVDEDKIALKKKSITVIDTRKGNESEHLQLSNFSVYEDRETKDIVVTLSRLFPKRLDDWTAPCMMYRIKVD